MARMIGSPPQKRETFDLAGAPAAPYHPCMVRISPVSALIATTLVGLLCLPLAGERSYGGGRAGVESGGKWTAETALVILGADTIRADVADEHAEHVRGLQGRTAVPEGTGLLFVFDRAAERSFWMVDTLVDLDIAFMDDDFRIIRIATMMAGSSDLTDSMGPARFALEVRSGWFAEKGIQVGTVAQVIFDPSR